MKPFRLFITILFPFFLCVLLIILLQSSYLYNSFEESVLEMIYNEQNTNLQSMSNNLNVMQETAKALSTQAFFDEQIKDILYSDVEPMNYSKYLNKLDSYKNIYPFLSSIYIYNGQNIYSTQSYYFRNDLSAFPDNEIVSILGDIENHKSHSIMLRKIPEINNPPSKNNSSLFQYVYSYLFYDSQQQSGKISEAIILNISAMSLWNDINTTSNKNNSRVFVLDKNQNLISSDSKYTIMSDLSDKDFVKLIQSSKDSVGSFKMNIDGIDSFVTFVAADVFDWKLVSITPYHVIMEDIDNMRQKTYLFVILLLIVGIICVTYLSRRLYIPIKSLVSNYRILEKGNLNDFYYKKQELLKSLINNDDCDKIRSFINDFPLYEISLLPEKKLLLILIKIDSYSEFCNKFNLEDRLLMKYGTMNIISELLSSSFKNECIDIDEDKIVALINYTDNHIPSNNEVLISIIRSIQYHTDKHLDISLSFSLSEEIDSLNTLNEEYRNTIDLSYYRLIYGPKSLIFRNTLIIPSIEFKYPSEKDKLLTDALLLEHITDAKKILSEIIAYASQYSITILNFTLLRLLFSINYVIEIINSNNDLNLKYNFNAYLSDLQKMETLNEIEKTFLDLFDCLSFEIELKKDNRYLKMVEKVIDIVNEGYANNDLSLEKISEMVNLSPSYIGRLFKKHKFISITEYINKVRLEKAKYLLRNTEFSILTIMEKLGFISRSHFFTLFKKVYGMTPNDYRTKSKISENETN